MPGDHYCAATSRVTGQRCRRHIRPEQVLCRWHYGNTPRIKAKAEARREAAAIVHRELTDVERRHPWEIITDAVQHLDAVMQSGELTGTAYIEHAERLIRACKVLLDAGVDQKMAEAVQRNVKLHAETITDAMIFAVDRLFTVLPIDPLDIDRHRQYILQSVHARLTDGELPELAPRAVAPARWH